MKKILFIAPHLSTGGLPQYLFKKIETLKTDLEVFCVEYENITGGVFVVQRNRIKEALDSEHFITLEENKKDELLNLIENIKPDYIHLEEIPEYFLPTPIADLIYVKDRKYKIFETSHDSSFNPDISKIYFPDAFFFVSNWQIEQYKNINVPKYLAEYPIEYKERPDRDTTLRLLGLDPNKKHILNVGLFTPRKNQAEIFETAKFFDDKVQFHFLGNQADNFKSYWEPLLKEKPQNCKVWGERNDTDLFFSCMDLFLFTSRGNNGDKETMPLVLREAIGWKIPILLYNLDVYQNYFDKYVNNGLDYLDQNIQLNVIKIKNKLGLVKDQYFSCSFDSNTNTMNFVVIKEHPNLKKFSIRMRDGINNLTFQPILKNYDFIINQTGWAIPSSSINYRDGVRIEFFHDDFLIEEYKFEDNPKTHWPPNIFPTNEILYKNKKINIDSDPNDHSSYWSFFEVFFKEDYQDLEVDDVVLDIGANLGFFSIYAAKQGAKKVYSLEPISKAYKYLEYNTKDIDVIETFKLGVGEKTEESIFKIDVGSSSISRKEDFNNNYEFQKNDDIIREKVNLININEFIEQNNIDKLDYLKIDCEGSELMLFETINEIYLKNNIRKISGEIHISLIGEEGHKKIIDKLKKCDFEIKQTIDENNSLSMFYAYNKLLSKSTKITVNPNYDFSNLAILVQSCDSYEKFWDGWYKSMKRYWPWELNIKIYFLTEEKDPFFVNDDNIEIIKIKEEDSRSGFSTRLIKALNMIEEDYIFYFQEDMWPFSHFDNKFLAEGFELFKQQNWNCLRFQERLWGNITLQKTNYFINNIRVLKYKNSSEWSLAHHPSIWNKKFLLDNLIENEDPWKNEILGTRRIYDKYIDTKIYHCNVRWYYQPGASQNGNLNPFMEEYLRNLNLTEELNNKFDLYG